MAIGYTGLKFSLSSFRSVCYTNRNKTAAMEQPCILLERDVCMEAIIYTSNTGSAERYARLLAEQTGLPTYSLAEAKEAVPAGAEVIYLGWIMAGSVKGYGAAAKRYRVRVLCGVGMWQTGTQADNVRKKMAIPAEIPVFTLQGNFDLQKLHGLYHFLMVLVVKTAGKRLANKAQRTPEEEDVLELMQHGGERVGLDQLSEVLAWYNGQK